MLPTHPLHIWSGIQLRLKFPINQRLRATRSNTAFRAPYLIKNLWRHIEVPGLKSFAAAGLELRARLKCLLKDAHPD
jgi:hypothetical protein